MSETKTTPSKRTLYVLILSFAVPILLAKLIFRFQDNFTFNTTETGILLKEPIPLRAYPLFDFSLLGQWQMVYVQASGYQMSDYGQEDMSPLLDQIYQAIGKESYRVNYQSISSNRIPFLTEGDIGIIDPEGWLVMYYPPGSDPQGIVKDMRRLLRTGHG